MDFSLDLHGKSTPLSVTYTDSGCWISLLHKRRKDGYLQITIFGKCQLIHRVVYESLKGKIPAKLKLDHLCRNRFCFNPDHLEAVTQKVNVLRGNGLAGINSRKANCGKCNLPLEGDNLILYNGGRYVNRRQCRACKVSSDREYHKRTKQAVQWHE